MLQPDQAPNCFLIADDLTGACDTGVQFVIRGLPCMVPIKSRRMLTVSGVLALNTASRNDTLEEARRKIEVIAHRYPELGSSPVFKKVDSTLRGKIAGEIEMTMRACGAGWTVFAPAFPAMKRIVRNGTLEWSDCTGAGQLEIRKLLDEQGVSAAALAVLDVNTADATYLAGVLSRQITRGARWILANTQSQDQLETLVAAGMKVDRRVLWSGSAGLASALAEHLTRGAADLNVPHSADAPVLFCIGSSHPVTLRQTKRLVRRVRSLEIRALPQNLDSILNALEKNRHVALRLDCERTDVAFLRRLLASLRSVRLAGIFFTGGDTSLALCNFLEVDRIDLRGEVAPGIPWGILKGGKLDGLPVITKSGGFGEEDTLVRCADFLSSSRKVLQEI